MSPDSNVTDEQPTPEPDANASADTDDGSSTPQSDASTSPDAEPKGSGVAAISAILLGVVAIAAAIGLWNWMQPLPTSEVMKQARQAFRRGDYTESLKLATLAYESKPTNRLALMAGESAQKLEDLDLAMEWYRKLEDDDSPDYLNGAIALALLCMDKGLMSESEEWFIKALAKEPRSVEVNRWYGTLLNVEGRRWEASHHFFVAVREGVYSGQTSMDDLLMLSNFEAPFEDAPITDKAMKLQPNDPLPMLGRVHTHFVLNRYPEGLEILEKVLAVYPDQLQAHAWLGRGLIDSGSLEKLKDWQADLPENADSFPSVWHVRGLWAAKVGQPRAAVRCFWEALRREPNFASASYQLGLTLASLNDKEKAQPFLDHHRRLSDYQQIAHPIYTEGPKAESLERLMDLSGELGRGWEQFGWSKFLLRYGQDNGLDPDLQNKVVQIYSELQQTLPGGTRERTRRESNPASSIDLSSYPLPDWSQSAATETQVVAGSGNIRFENIAEQLGLQFTYVNNAEPRALGLRIFEGMGGGTAAIDFDCDGWPDLYFTQGSAWPVDPANPGKRDCLFRSIAGTAVEDVTASAGLGDADYSQGVTMGDFDSDGFPDLYVGNIGKNRLYRNNGDGTFTEVSLGAEGLSQEWTTSVLIADLNADGHPDIFDANYVTGDDVFEKLCGDPPRVCAPSAFEAAQDDIYLNNGNGTWTKATESTGLNRVVGKGLGLLAADFDGNGRLNVFVANDGIANNYLLPSGEGSALKLTDAALERGLAFDYDSRGQACMGVAADDYNGDERLDLFVTNYYEDSNTLYTMLPGDLFEDRARETNMRTPSFLFLGFGTQFVDADLDGWPDLVVTNGHVDDFTHSNIPFRMRPQFYRNVGGRFDEVAPPPDSKYMNEEQLGRGLARLDFDRDGRFDFAVSHLDTPAAVARNMTPEAGHYLTVRLLGIESPRDAIGTTVTVEAGNRRRVMQLTAGDGYMCTNERSLNFGLGESETIDRLIVQWPSGVRQTFPAVSANAEVAVREDDNTLYSIPR